MENQLSQAQMNLIECLKFLEITPDAITTILLLIPQDEQIAEMADYLLENPKVAEAKIIEQAVMISEM